MTAEDVIRTHTRGPWVPTTRSFAERRPGSGGRDERRCSDDKSSRWNCGHYTGQRKAPLAEGLALERNLFLKLCISERALARMRSYVEANITSPSRSIVVKGD